jgi:hypothetical protein
MKNEAPLDARPQQALVTHSVLVGLTPLIPVPLLDDAVKSYIERRLTRAIGELRGLDLSKETVAELVDDIDGSLLRSIAIGVITFPAKLIFRKLFVVLEVKRASDEASRAYHRGYLLDRALASKLMMPAGPRSPKEIRAALDAACADGAVSPIGGVMRAVFSGSKDVMETAGKSMIARLRGKRGKVSEETVSAAVDETAAPEGPVGTIAQRLQAALGELPADHFRELEARFELALGDKLTPPRPVETDPPSRPRG